MTRSARIVAVFVVLLIGSTRANAERLVLATKIILKWTTFLQELDNGNVIVGNCHAGEKNPQICEITRDKKVVWEFNQYGIFGNGLACSQVLSDQQSALVRKLLAATPI